MSELLRCEGLALGFTAASAPLLHGVDLVIGEGEAVALSGPSGCGKTLLARALLGLLPSGAWCDGRLLWEGRDPTTSADGWKRLRGGGISWLPQDPLGGLNPLLRVGEQVAESARLAGAASRAEARGIAAGLLAEMQLPDPERLLDAWPHQLSGGMRQRALLAAVLARRPRLLLADEPTSSLDAPLQRELLALLDRARRARGLALLFITHDRDLAPLVADRCLEIRGGRLVALSAVATPNSDPVPAARAPGIGEPALAAAGLEVRYPGARAFAVAGVDLELHAGRAVGLVGGSGSGKSSLARALAGHLVPGAGTVTVAGLPQAHGDSAPARAARRRVQMLFQDAGASLDPRQRVGDALTEAAAAAGAATESVAVRLLAEVGLPAELAARHPHALSGGQRQRVALARCLAAGPAVLIADEPTSALDAEARDRILALLGTVMVSRGLAVLLVTHDVDTASAFCDELLVMHSGRIVERAPAAPLALLRHPHSRLLLACRPAALAALPQWSEGPVRDRVEVGGAPSSGCPLAGGCPLQNASCFKELPPLAPLAPGHWLRCPPASELPSPQFIDT
jgi:ABC-type glutathione transport system ATPase component